ncbi:hypothetical protein [Pseudactinotalea sp.]|uniref:hypothetical protein n=1 Tax=Pseudactinotalea sp. TaxID=1926260 RepID=UPI003B3AD5E9
MSGADSPRGYDGLIDPSQFPFRSEQMDLESLADAAETVRGMGTGVSEAADDLVGSWSRLQPVYGGPREEQVWGLMSPVAGTAGRLESDMTTAAGRLDDLASSLVVLKAQMADLEERATAFRASCLIGVRAPVTEGAEFVVTLGTEWAIIPWDQDTDTVARNEDLLLEHAKLVERITTASAECHNALMDLVAWATDAHDVEGVSAQELMDRRVEYPWGTPVAEDRNWAESIGHGAYMFGFNIAAGVTGLALGYDLRMEEYRDGYRGELAAGLGNAWLSSSVSAAWMMLAASSPGVASWVQEQMPDDARRWLHDRQVVTASMGGDLVGVDVQAHLAGEDALWRWREDGIATGTESVLNIGSMFVPSGGAASGALRTGSFGARLLRITTGAADFVIPGTSALTYGGIRVASGLRTAITRLDDVPVVQPNAAGVAGEVVDAADPNTIGVDRPLSDELFGDGVDGGGGSLAGAENVDIGHGGTSPTDAPAIQVDRTDYATTVSSQKQARHVLDSPRYYGGGYFAEPQAAQAILDAFHDGSAEVLGLKPNGDVVLRVEGVTGFHVSGSYHDQLTNVFFVKGTVSPSVVPYNPEWLPRPPRP